MPNIDEMDDEDLLEAIDAFKTLAKIAKLQLQARPLRLGGYIESAMDVETKIDRMYNTLPLDYRW